jgi:hypothetical protein
MHRSVVIHHRTAWCRSHRATSRCTAGRVWRWSVGRGGTRVASATLPLVTASLPQRQPDQKAIGQHDRDGMPMKARPQPPLVLGPPQLALGLCMHLLDRMPPMGQGGQLFEGGGGGRLLQKYCRSSGGPRGARSPTNQPSCRCPSLVTRQPRTPTNFWRRYPVVPCRQRTMRHGQRGTVWSR